jgi:hypothetical protein
MNIDYEQRLLQSIKWLIKSSHKNGGSRAYFSPLKGWSKSYPETTGYIIPTLLTYHEKEKFLTAKNTAIDLGKWLCSIQNEEGSWNGGYHPASGQNPSIFNTAQILFGMVALFKESNKESWMISAHKAATWLANQSGPDGLWEEGHYNNFNPTYYTRVAWPMLLVAETLDDDYIKKNAIKTLDTLLKRQNDNGSFQGWGFSEEKPAFTHTIVYTIRGFIESSILLDDWQRYGKPVETTMNKIYKLAELNNGRLAGAYDLEWNPKNYYTCLSGNAQMALCLMRWHQQYPDLRLLNAASKLIDTVAKAQVTSLSFKSMKGAIAGSKPIWGRYMFMRYPNWAAKFYADSLILFTELLKKEKKEWSMAGSY